MLQGLITSNTIATFALAVAVGSFVVSLVSVVATRRAHHDKEILDQLILTLTRAFSSLSKDGVTSLTRDRLAWLTAARHLLAYHDLKSRLKTRLYKALCDEHEEYWRHQFSLLLEEIQSHKFFGGINLESMETENIEPTSAAVVLAFSTWPAQRTDPIDAVSFETIVRENELLSVRFRHFREFVSKNFSELYERSDGQS